MKREIKFRAFLNSEYYEKPCMLSWEELLEQYDAIDMFQKDLMTLMQYTGLKDKNGREIYEGDIVKNEYGKAMDIQYDPRSAAFGVGDYYFGTIGSGRILEVIGNIFENPELLEGKQ